MTETEFEGAWQRVGAWIAAYYRDPARYPVLSRSRPGDLISALPDTAPEHGAPMDAILDDFERLIVPGITHWNHPRFFAYFAISAGRPTVLAEALAATLDVNAMLWRTSPAATELEDVTLGWLRRLLGLGDAWHGIIYDTASIAGFTALATAREALGLDVRAKGMSGLPPLRVYLTEHTHSHIEKAAIALGIGRDNVVRVPVDDAFRMRPDALAQAIDADLARGLHPLCVAATVGTTSTTSIDPVPRIAAVTRERGVWLHVDAAYAGPAAIVPEFRWLLDGVESADSLVVNPHKWMFVPVDLSVLYTRQPEMVRRAFALVADYLVTPETGVRNYMDYGLQLGRRFRALKLWFALRSYGASHVRDVLRAHVVLAQDLAAQVRAAPEWEVAAPHPLSVVCLRHVPADRAGDLDALDAHQTAIAEGVNATGEAFVSTTRLLGRTVIRVAIGNERTTADDVAACWRLMRSAAEAVVA